MSLLRPALIVPRVWDVDFGALSAAGRRVVLLDVDNTVAGRTEPHLHPHSLAALKAARDAGHIEAMCLVSNTGAPWKEPRIHRMARALDAEAVCARFWELKPSPVPFRRALSRLGVEPARAVMIGDQVFTDIVGANRLGIMTVLVEPFGPDGWTTRLTLRRVRERRLRAEWARACGLSDGEAGARTGET